MSLKIAIAQINATVGDLAGNATRIVEFAERAKAQGADLLLTPDGRYVFLEVNPNGEFGWLESFTDFPLTEALGTLVRICRS